MPKINNLDSKTFVRLVTESSRYVIKEKTNTTPAMPLEVGANLYLYSLCNFPEEFGLSTATVIRWGILYELLSIMEFEDSKRFSLHVKNSIPFITEWLDDLFLLQWDINSDDTLVDWKNESLEKWQYILDHCKHCFKRIEEPVPIFSLHNFLRHDKDCDRQYDKGNFKKTSQTIGRTEAKLDSLIRSIAFSNFSKRQILIDEFKEGLKIYRLELHSIASRWLRRLKNKKNKWFYNKADFDPVKGKHMVKVYCPANTHPRYGEFNRLNHESPGLRHVFNNMNKSNFLSRVDFADLIRMYFHVN